VIYGCKPPLRETHFQVAVMGELSDEDISRFVKALGDVRKEFRAVRSRIPSGRSGDKPASAI
jgi:hypothetical protein